MESAMNVERTCERIRSERQRGPAMVAAISFFFCLPSSLHFANPFVHDAPPPCKKRHRSRYLPPLCSQCHTGREKKEKKRAIPLLQEKEHKNCTKEIPDSHCLSRSSSIRHQCHQNSTSEAIRHEQGRGGVHLYALHLYSRVR